MLTDLPLPAVDLAVTTLREINPDLPGIIGPSVVADAFAERWSPDAKATVNERLYRLGDLEPPEVTGRARMASEDDIPMLAKWRDEFYAEALPSEPQTAPAEEIVRRSFALGYGHAVWEIEGAPVAWAMAGKPNAGMSRIGPVYTPPALRKRGYGAGVSAAASQWALDQGAEHVVLFADLLNPISNSIYQRIGYHEVVDWTQYEW
jgi:predicted GNAT family acetyltransferase